MAEKEEKDTGLLRLKRNQGLTSLDPQTDAAVSGIARLLSGKLDTLDSTRIKKIRDRYQRLRLEEEKQEGA